MPPGGDPAFLIFWFFFIKKKERTKETNSKKISPFSRNDSANHASFINLKSDLKSIFLVPVRPQN